MNRIYLYICICWRCSYLSLYTTYNSNSMSLMSISYNSNSILSLIVIFVVIFFNDGKGNVHTNTQFFHFFFVGKISSRRQFLYLNSLARDYEEKPKLSSAFFVLSFFLFFRSDLVRGSS